jgi:hypothetical protein
MDDTTNRMPSAWDRGALWATILIGVVAAGWTLVAAVLRIIEIAPNRDVPVPASFADTESTLPLGDDGGAVTVIVDRVTVFASDMAPITVFSLIASVVIGAIATVVVIGAVCILTREIIRGRAFSTRSVGAVGVAVITALIGWIGHWLFSTMGTNGALAALDAFEASTQTPVGPTFIFGIAALGALSAAWVIGGRIQRETEGLV